MPHLYLYRIQADQASLRPFLLRKVITFYTHLCPRMHVTAPHRSRCLAKLQKRGKPNCPICRAPTVLQANPCESARRMSRPPSLTNRVSQHRLWAAQLHGGLVPDRVSRETACQRTGGDSRTTRSAWHCRSSRLSAHVTGASQDREVEW